MGPEDEVTTVGTEEQARRDHATTLAVAWRVGNVEAGAQLLEEFAPLINKATIQIWRRSFRTVAVDYEDVRQNCAMAFLETARKWEGRGGTSFLGYVDKVYFWYAMNAQRSATNPGRLEVAKDNSAATSVEPIAPDDPLQSVLLKEVWNQLTDTQQRVVLLTAGVPRLGRKNSARSEVAAELRVSERAVRRTRARIRNVAEEWNGV